MRRAKSITLLRSAMRQFPEAQKLETVTVCAVPRNGPRRETWPPEGDDACARSLPAKTQGHYPAVEGRPFDSEYREDCWQGRINRSAGEAGNRGIALERLRGLRQRWNRNALLHCLAFAL